MKHSILTLLAIIILTGCGNSVITTMDNPYEDGDTDSEGTENEATEEEVTEEEATEDSDVEDEEATEEEADFQTDNDTEVTEDEFPISYEDQRGTCPEGQICLQLAKFDEPSCYTQEYLAPEDAPLMSEYGEAPSGYGPETRIDEAGEFRWLEQCENELWECSSFIDGICCNSGF